MARRKSSMWTEDKTDLGSCPICLKLYKLLPKDKYGQAVGLQPDCSCAVGGVEDRRLKELRNDNRNN